MMTFASCDGDSQRKHGMFRALSQTYFTAANLIATNARLRLPLGSTLVQYQSSGLDRHSHAA